MSTTPRLNGQYCEVCAECYGNSKVPAKVYVLGQWLCMQCSNGCSPLSRGWTAKKKEESLSWRLRVRPPKVQAVDAEDVLKGKGSTWEEEWVQFFKQLMDLPPGKAMIVTPSRSMRAEDRYLRKVAERYGVQVRIWNDGKSLYVVQRDKNANVRGLRQAVVVGAK